MKVICITDNHLCLTKGKIYDARFVDFHGHKMVSLFDDDNDECCYGLENFENIEGNSCSIFINSQSILQ